MTSTPALWSARIGMGLFALAMVLMLVLSPTLGSASSVLALLLTLPLLAVLGQPGALAELARAPSQWIFAGVVLVLTLCYTATAQKPGDILFFANFLGMLLSSAIFLMAHRHAGTRAGVLLARFCVAGAMVALVATGWDALVNHSSRAMGLVGNPNLVPRMALPLGFIALAGIWLDTGPRRWLYVLGPVAALLATYFSGSRGGALAIPVMGLVALIFLWREPSTRRLALGALVAGVLAMLALVLLYGGALVGRFGTILDVTWTSLTTGSAGGDFAVQERLNMYAAGWQGFQLRPWIGWGWAHLGDVAAMIDPTHFAKEAGTGFMYHNDWINFAVAAGVVGWACLVALLAAPLAGALASTRDRYFPIRLYGALVLSLGFLVFGFTDSTLGYDAPTTLYAYLTALLLGAVVEPRAKVTP